MVSCVGRCGVCRFFISGILPLRRQNTLWGCSSAGRALPSQGRGRGFESHHLHHNVSKGITSCVMPFLLALALGTSRELLNLRIIAKKSTVYPSRAISVFKNRVIMPCLPTFLNAAKTLADQNARYGEILNLCPLPAPCFLKRFAKPANASQ